VLTSWAAELTVSPSAIDAGLVCVGVVGHQPVGLVELSLNPSGSRIEGLWISPAFMRRGVGRALLAWALARARRAGYTMIDIDADPHAEPFYLTQGAKRVRVVQAPLPGNPDRVRPQLRIQLLSAALG
jgi:GNAT superfamily N-acetyltransferase